ncbi:MAG TPA: SNF2-related protein [Gammaproteobacteria bacterium]|nr:SNF2-related protein [Gammaproteobacteria bacterium]
MENHLGELWALFHFLMPGLLGERERFTRLFRRPIEKHGDSVQREQLQQRIAPFLLCRTKAAVAAELPAKTREPAQRCPGRRAVRSSSSTTLLKLRQICCDPRLVKSSGAPAASSARPSSRGCWRCCRRW